MTFACWGLITRQPGKLRPAERQAGGALRGDPNGSLATARPTEGTKRRAAECAPHLGNSKSPGYQRKILNGMH